MLVSTEISSLSSLVGEEKAIEYYAKAGFDAWDFSMFSMFGFDWKAWRASKTNHPLSGDGYLAFAKKLRSISDSCGIVCNQSHAPFPSVWPEVKDYLKRALECTAVAGGKICIIHPDNNKTPEQNAEMYDELTETADEYGVIIATENMWNWDNEKGHSCFAACATPESFNAHLDAVKKKKLAACLDIGHAEMLGSETNASEMILKLGDRLKALHIHDNDKLHDSHQIPFSMNIDFASVAEALKKINYNGYLTLESDAFLGAYTAENAFDGACGLYRAVCRFRDMVENRSR